MIYIILVIVGVIGVSVTLWMSHPRLQLDHVPHGDPWYVLHPENFESGFIQYGRSVLRFWIKKTRPKTVPI
ncbi:MAG: hypothetical protein EB060_12600 [Proteobacteria bacterium]|nr:hypothetical protein [Pseudomonadota bacterium]